jgi:hypothetical protein
MQRFDVICTSCGRHDLLTITFESFMDNLTANEKKHLGNIFIYEDGSKLPAIEGIEYGILYDVKRVGQIKALDALMQKVNTPYYFSLEDDWQFVKSGFIELSFEALARHDKMINLLLRGTNNANGHPELITDNDPFNILTTAYKGIWHGFSFNPSLRRLHDYRALPGKTYAKHARFNFKKPWISESEIGELYRRMGYYAGNTKETYCIHTGDNRGIRS